MRAESRETLLDHGMNAVLRTPYKFLVTASLHGLALGVLLGSAVLRAGDAGTALLNALSFTAAAVLLLLTALFVKMDFNHLIYQVGFSIMATGALLIALAPPPRPPGSSSSSWASATCTSSCGACAPTSPSPSPCRLPG
ncbi:hypothetical protein [Adlercreutzia muris]|uniref:hypothetical protein n=1 Tax=Adlercreutzia muris TaxID=1796610 RepID=UPI001F0E3613|nr:hypothetical protein [Adlercreutzia muris]MCR2027408.1 hypothetical protein [Adlercreutzia muris]